VLVIKLIVLSLVSLHAGKREIHFKETERAVQHAFTSMRAHLIKFLLGIMRLAINLIFKAQNELGSMSPFYVSKRSYAGFLWQVYATLRAKRRT